MATHAGPRVESEKPSSPLRDHTATHGIVETPTAYRSPRRDFRRSCLQTM
jgi:hypothetical protein